jgi:hypothetical protein
VAAGGFLGVELSWASLQPPSNFAKYDAVVVCVGTNNEYEGEGYDQPFQLPEGKVDYRQPGRRDFSDASQPKDS